MKGEGEALALAEKVLAILELGSFSATYKYALFTAILDLCIEKTSAGGVPPSVITTAELARKVVELYWPHATPYDGKAVLRQGGVRAGNQAEIVRAIETFRTRHAGASGDLLHRARTANPTAWQALARPGRVEAHRDAHPAAAGVRSRRGPVPLRVRVEPGGDAQPGRRLPATATRAPSTTASSCARASPRGSCA